MKFITQVFVIAIFALILEMALPWWGIFIAALIGGFAVSQKDGMVFIAGFLGIGLLWLLQIYLIDADNASILSNKVAQIFGLSSGFMMILLSAVIGGLCGGIGAMLGKSLRALV